MNCPAMKPPLSDLMLSASSTAPCMPLAPGERTTSAPYAFISEMRSLDIVSGMTITALYPLAAAIIAMAMPVFPDVGSMMVPPSSRTPRATASLIMDRAARSLMDPAGFPLSIFT